jgi:hypothetical protein
MTRMGETINHTQFLLENLLENDELNQGREKIMT